MRVGVVGAGVMGTGVAQTVAEAGHTVVLVDISEDVLRRAMVQIAQHLRLAQLLGRRTGTRDVDEVTAAIRCSTGLDELAEADFVVENIPERWDAKAALYPRLDAICPAGCVLAANTSAIPITRIASLTGRVDRVVGIHFMNPVPLVQAVELIAGHHTSPDTLARARELLAGMGKEAIEVADSPGFVSNRVLMLTINEAANLVHDQVAAAHDVDRVFTSCFGHPMGPLATADLIGLDTVLDSIDVLYDSYRDPKYRPSPALRWRVDAGLCGRKTGQGFYTYDKE